MAVPSTFVLVHSPLVGSATWRGVASELIDLGHAAVVPSMLGFLGEGPPYWPDFVRRLVTGCEEIDGPLVLVPHSGAGPLLPSAIGLLGDRVTAVIFAEAAMAPETGAAELAPPWLRERLGALAVDGILPPWSDWWGPDRMAELIPDAGLRAELDAEQPTLPLDYFDQTVTVPDGWSSGIACTYLWFSDAYAEDAAEAERRGWNVERLPGTHLHGVTHPAEVAAALVSITS